MKLLFMTLFMVSLSQLGLSQVAPRLVNEEERPNCETLLASVDLLRMELLGQADSRGAIVISGPDDQLFAKIKYEQLIWGALVGRRADMSSLIDVVRGVATPTLVLRYWLMPKNTTIDKAVDGDLRVKEGSEPLLLRSDMAQICEPPPIDRVAKDLLDSNPNGSLFVVVHGSTFSERRKELRLAKKMLAAFDPVRVRYLLRQTGVAHSNAAYSDYYFAIGNPPRTAFKGY